MVKGGARPGAGRKPGIPNKATIKRQQEIAATGETPLDYMMRVMRDPAMPAERRDEMAKAAAPYVHPRLSAVEHSAPRSQRRLEDIDARIAEIVGAASLDGQRTELSAMDHGSSSPKFSMN